MTEELVRIAKSNGPVFRLPPPEIALIASLGDVGLRIGANDAALELIVALLAETHRRGLEDFTRR